MNKYSTIIVQSAAHCNLCANMNAENKVTFYYQMNLPGELGIIQNSLKNLNPLPQNKQNV